MLETAQTQTVPNYIEMTFHINHEQSETFWQDESMIKDRTTLLDEWDADGKSRYTKEFYGIKYAIQFNYVTDNVA